MKSINFVTLVLFITVCACSDKALIYITPDPGITPETVSVLTGYGTASGYRSEKGINTFLGIPYAKAPLGERRFAPPQDTGKWDAPVSALRFGPSCPQVADEFEPASLYIQNENCLSLNIWTPGLDNKKRPVIIYIHGGGFLNGGTADPLYNGSSIAERGDLVFVSVNYRVAAFGFLYLDEFGEEYRGSGNIALQDQLMGIRWAGKNIEKFDGDPENITIMGESAGSASVLILMGLPQAKGLFKRVIAESGACHAIELPFVLGTFGSPTSAQIVGPNPPMELSRMMQDAWIAFARKGDPNHPGIPAWPHYDTARRGTMIFNTESKTEDDPEKDVRLFYKGISY